ncbi:MAG: hypothetical protein IJI09_01660 [Clostridia bacterium]|nr:hypothetical protein [Clostridia bacterium]
MERFIVFFEIDGREEHEIVDADSRQEAREIFAARYSGRFEINEVCREEELA